MQWLALYTLNFLFTIFSMLTCWIWPYFATLEFGPINNCNGTGVEPRLPKWLHWFGTPDNSLLGDAGHKMRWNGRSRYLQMAAWLFRNPCYNFGIEVCGARIVGGMLIEVTGDPNIKNRDNGVAGQYFCRVGKYWNFKKIIDNGNGTCWQIEFGWKLQDYAKGWQLPVMQDPQIVGWIRRTTFTRATDEAQT